MEIRIKLAEHAFDIVDDEGVRRQDGHNFDLYVGMGQPDARTEQLTGEKCVKTSVRV